MNPLQLLPAKARMTIYAIYGVLALGATSAGAYYTALGQDLPAWLVGGGAALVPIGGAFAAVAVSNTTKPPDTNTAVVSTPADVAIDVTPADDGLESLPNDTDPPSAPMRGYGSGV